MASLDESLAITAADAEFFRLFDQDSAEACGRSLYSLLHPSAPGLLNRHFARLAEGQRARFVERMVGIRGEEVPFSGELTGVAVRSDSAQAPSFVVVVRPDDDSAASLTGQEDAPPGAGSCSAGSTHRSSKVSPAAPPRCSWPRGSTSAGRVWSITSV